MEIQPVISYYYYKTILKGRTGKLCVNHSLKSLFLGPFCSRGESRFLTFRNRLETWTGRSPRRVCPSRRRQSDLTDGMYIQRAKSQESWRQGQLELWEIWLPRRQITFRLATLGRSPICPHLFVQSYPIQNLHFHSQFLTQIMYSVVLRRK